MYIIYFYVIVCYSLLYHCILSGMVVCLCISDNITHLTSRKDTWTLYWCCCLWGKA